MKKLKLDLDLLAIESFETAASAGGEGTVVGHGPKPRPSDQGTCYQNTCVEDCYWTLWESCNCPYSREASCLCLDSQDVTCIC